MAIIKFNLPVWGILFAHVSNLHGNYANFLDEELIAPFTNSPAGVFQVPSNI